MMELHRHIGPDVDVPAGDIGVGAREIGYLYGEYKRLANNHTGVITGKSLSSGGSQIRKEATGYGCVYFVDNMLREANHELEGKKCLISGSGNVAQYTAEKLLDFGAKVLTMSDSGGFIHDPDGIDREKLAWVVDLKTNKRGRISEYAEEYKTASYHENQQPWGIPCDIAFPSATQNEILEEDARTLVKNGCMAIGEGANMPTHKAGIEIFQKANLLYAPSKAANAGGVSVSALEMAQNSMRMSWDWEELDTKLKNIMSRIHRDCVRYGQIEGGRVDYVRGANIAGFIKVADSMLSYGVT